MVNDPREVINLEKTAEIYTLVWEDEFILKSDEKPSQSNIFLYSNKKLHHNFLS